MIEIPRELIKLLSPSALDIALRWWSSLSDASRAELAELFNTNHNPPNSPKIIGGRFLSDDEAAGWREWTAEYFEHLVAQPDSNIVDPPFIRIFHIG